MTVPPDAETLKQHVRDGMDFHEIAELYGLKYNTVWRKAQRAGLAGNRMPMRDFIPWSKVEREHQRSHVYDRLRVLRRVAEGNEEYVDGQRHAEAWRDDLIERGLVLCYDPKMGPNNATDLGGFYYRDRRDGDYEWFGNPNL